MAKILKLVDNYVIFEQDGTPTGEYAINKSVYREEAETFLIKETIDNGELVIRKSDVDLGTVWFKSDGDTPFNVSDLRDFLRKNTGFKTAPGGSGAIGAKVLKTNQTISYRTGDDGDLQKGREVDFYTLSSNNPFGNTNRFTDELGGSTYANDIVIDWSTYDNIEGTVLGYRRTSNSSNVNWETAIDQCLLVSIGKFTSGWRLPNRAEIFNIVVHEGGTFNYPLNYPPFNISLATIFWSGTTYASNSSQAFTLTNNASATLSGGIKTGNGRYFPCRTFTVTGTTLS